MTPSADGAGTPRRGSLVSDLRVVLRGVGFRRLFAVRLAGQFADGMFQVALASLFFFSPERQSSAAGVAAAFAVLLLPFTVVGPFAGVLLDRWRRRQVLLLGNLLRAVTVVLTAAALVGAGPGPLLYALVLAALSVNRFLLAALSAALPKVVPREQLLMANAVSPTSGAAAAFAGAGCGVVLRPFLGAGDAGDARLLLVVAAACVLAAVLALRLGLNQLGPDRWEAAAPPPAPGAVVRLVWRDLLDGVRHVRERRTPALALGTVAAHRLAYATTFIAMILMSRNLLTDPADVGAALALMGTVIVAVGAGFVTAALVTPAATRRLSNAEWITACFLLAAATQAALAVRVSSPAVVAGGFVLGLAAQGSKISVDTIVQRDTDDGFRGRVFVLYDAVYNASFVAAAAVAVLVVPDTGYSRWLFAAIAGWYAVTGIGYLRATRSAVA